jgi:hypothetical protein
MTFLNYSHTSNVNKKLERTVVFGLLMFGLVACGGNSSNTKTQTTHPVPHTKKVVDNTSRQSCQTPLHESLGLQWSNGTTVHWGIMKLKGCQGLLTVSFWDEQFKKTAQVEQSIKISNTSLGIMLYGYNPSPYTQV